MHASYHAGGRAAMGGAAAGGGYAGGAGFAGGAGYAGGVAAGGVVGGVAGGSMGGGVMRPTPYAGGGGAEVDAGCACDVCGCGEACGCGVGSGVGCAEGCAVSTGAASMTFVGAGRGDYITETSYKFVGRGAGNLAMVSPKTILYGRIACMVSVPLLLLLLLVLLMKPSSSTTSTTNFPTTYAPFTPPPEPQPRVGTCTFWGDPHVLTFDGGRPSFYGEGEWWVVKSATVHIQGRFKGTQYTKGLAATRKIAVGGPFLRGNTIVVGAMEEGPITVNGQPVLTSFPSSYSLPNGAGSISYSGNGQLVDQATNIWQKRVVRMDLPMGVTMEVFRWTNYLDFRLTMTAQPNQDGCCGNYNGNPADDSSRQVMMRIGARVGPGENMFNHRTQVNWTGVEEKLLAMCPPERVGNADSFCAHSGPAGSNSFKACKLDMCFGANEHALRMTNDLHL